MSTNSMANSNLFLNINQLYSIYQNINIHTAYVQITENLIEQYMFNEVKFSNNMKLVFVFLNGIGSLNYDFSNLSNNESIIAYGFISNFLGFSVKKSKQKDIYFDMFSKTAIRLFHGMETDYDYAVNQLLNFMCLYTIGLLDIIDRDQIPVAYSNFVSLSLTDKLSLLGANYRRLGLIPNIEEPVKFKKYLK